MRQSFRHFEQRIQWIKEQHADFLLILALFVLFRLMMLMAYWSSCLDYCSDYLYYFNLAALSKQGYLPFIHYWSEYPPIFPYLNLAIYRLTGDIFQRYVFGLGLLMLLAESGTLTLLYRLADEIYERERAIKLCWIYATLFLPLYFWRGTFDSLAAFFMLLALFALLTEIDKHPRGGRGLLGVSLGIGAMLKFIPLALLPAIWRRRGLWQMVQASILTLLISLAILAPLFVISPEVTGASLQSQGAKSSWQTIWALVDGNTTNTGSFGPIDYHFDPQRATTPQHNPSRISPLVTLLVFGGIGLYAFSRPTRLPPNRDAVTFATLTLVMMFLWSKGWSPQWQMYLIPLLLLSLPVGRALLFIINLGLINFLEWPLIFNQGPIELMPLTIIARTFIFVLLAWELYRIR
jgi:hypothetical protein